MTKIMGSLIQNLTCRCISFVNQMFKETQLLEARGVIYIATRWLRSCARMTHGLNLQLNDNAYEKGNISNIRENARNINAG